MTQGLATDTMLSDAVMRAGFEGATVTPGPPALASPSCKALESASCFVARPLGAHFVKVMHPEMTDAFDLPAAMALATAAGAAGVGPPVSWSDPSRGAIAMEALTLGEGWRTANQYILQDDAVLAATMKAVNALHNCAGITSVFDPFSKIDAGLARADACGANLPDDIVWLRRLIAEIEPLKVSATLAPCRNDGAASNVMIGPDNEVRLIDFDRAGLNDPLYDVGVLLAEVTEFESEMKAGFIVYDGGFDPARFARAMLWSNVDDLLHAVSARVLARVSARTGLEWLKYSEWRLMRLRMSLNHPQFEERLRIAGVSK